MADASPFLKVLVDALETAQRIPDVTDNYSGEDAEQPTEIYKYKYEATAKLVRRFCH